MTRVWIGAGVVVLLVLWWFVARTLAALVVLLVAVAIGWGWWEVRELRRAMRTPPK